MDRDYLITIISGLLTGKKLLKLSSSEISEKISKTNLPISNKMKSLLNNKKRDELDNEEHICMNHTMLYPAVRNLSTEIMLATREGKFSDQKMAKIFDDVVLLLSIYWEYKAVLRPESMYVFLRLVLKEKILLV